MKKPYTKPAATSTMVHISPDVRHALDYLIQCGQSKTGETLTYSQAARAVLEGFVRVSNHIEQAETMGIIKKSTDQ